MFSQLGKEGCAVERFGGFGKKVSGHKSGHTNAEQKTRYIKKCDRRQAQMNDCMTKSLKK